MNANFAYDPLLPGQDFTTSIIFEEDVEGVIELSVPEGVIINGGAKKEIKDKVHDICEKVGLKKSINNYPSQLSGGENQRVSIARALVKKPLVILADEPTGNLDPNVSDEILDLLEIATNSGAAVLMSTHNFPLIQPRKKRFIELNEGRLVVQ